MMEPPPDVRQEETAKLNVPAAELKPPGGPPITVKALPYPAKRPSRAHEWLDVPSDSSWFDSSSQGLYAEVGGMPGGSDVDSGNGGGKSGGGGSAGGKKAQKSWTKTPAGLALSAPLLPSSDSKQVLSHSPTPGDGMTLDRSNYVSNSRSSDSSSDESQESRDIATKEIAGSRGRQSLGVRRGLLRRAALLQRVIRSGTLMSSMKATEIFAAPLASEGAGSVFPIALPMAKRRAYEADFIKRFDRLAINSSSGEFWTVIDASWMSNWVDFIMGNKPPPGPISNYQLYDQHSIESEAQRKSLLVKHAVSSTAVSGVLTSHPHLVIKTGLQILKDYRVIHPVVWFIFREIYDTDGSPDVFRWRSDIYSAEVVGARKARYVEEVHTKALYKLRRFSAHVKESVEARGA